MRYLAIDYGKKRTGVAVCDDMEKVASPLAVIEGQRGLVEKICKITGEENADAVVVGLPLNMDDSEGPQAKLVRYFACRLQKCLNIPIIFFDERLSSFEAEEKLVGSKLSRGKKRKRLDAVAAAGILQSFLDQKHSRDN